MSSSARTFLFSHLYFTTIIFSVQYLQGIKSLSGTRKFYSKVPLQLIDLFSTSDLLELFWSPDWDHLMRWMVSDWYRAQQLSIILSDPRFFHNFSSLEFYCNTSLYISYRSYQIITQQYLFCWCLRSVCWWDWSKTILF